MKTITLLTLITLVSCSSNVNRFQKKDLLNFKVGQYTFIGDSKKFPSGILATDVERVPGRRDRGRVCQISVVGNSSYNGKQLGAIVKILKFNQNGRVKIKSIINDCTGWINKDFLAKNTTVDDCKKYFDVKSYKLERKKCLKFSIKNTKP